MSRLTEIADRARAEGVSPWLAIKSEGVAVVLEALGSDPGPAVLQDGAALHFVYASPRLSLDVDYVGLGVGAHLSRRGPDLAGAVEGALGAPVAWSESVSGRLTRGKLTLSLPAGTTLALPIEAFEIPARRPVSSPAGPVEVPEEIIADKVVATADRLSRRGSAKLTDLFDLWYLRSCLGAPMPEVDLVRAKVSDYGQPTTGIDSAAWVRALAPEDLHQVLERVLPARNLATVDLAAILATAHDVLEAYRELV